MYKLAGKDETGRQIRMIHRIADDAWIPMDNGNTDYQEFLRWCEQGNTPEPADE
jgi:hypothetical protein